MPPTPVRPAAPTMPWRPPVAHDELATGPTEGLDEPLEVDSSLQSGGHSHEPPWKAGAQARKKKSQPKEKPRAANPPTNPAQWPKPGEVNDPEFGHFLEGLE